MEFSEPAVETKRDENKRLPSEETETQIRRAVAQALPYSDVSRGGCVRAKPRRATLSSEERCTAIRKTGNESF